MTERDYKNIGNILRLRRKRKGLTLETVAEFAGVSINYISELERGTKGKVPSDAILQRLAMILTLDEKEVFEGFGKLPASIVQELESNDMLLNTLYEIKNNPNLTIEDRNKLYSEIHNLYLKHLRK